MKITVESSDGFSFDIQARPNDSVADVKWNIGKRCGQTLYPVQDQKLKYGEKVLKDDTTLKDNNIRDNCSIYLTRVVPSSNSVPPSSTNPDSTPSPLTTVTANLDVHSANLPAGSSFDLTIQSFDSDIREGASRRNDVDRSSCDAFENTIKRALRYQPTVVPAHVGDSPVASQLAQLAAVQASQHTQTAAEASQPTPPAPPAPEAVPAHARDSPVASQLAQLAAVQASQHTQTAAEASQPTPPAPPAPEGIPTRHRVLAQIAAVQASQLVQAASEASQPATPPYKYKGTPARARLLMHLAAGQAPRCKQTAAQASQPAPPAPAAAEGLPACARVSLVACPQTSSSAADAPLLPSLVSQLAAAQASQPAPPAPKVSEVNATPLNLFQDIHYRGLDHVKDNPQLRASRALVQANPHILEPMLEELGRQNPDVRQSIQDNLAEFMQDMLQLSQRPVGNLTNQSADAIPQEITFTLEEREAIDRLEAMGFDRKMVVQVFIACNKDEALAAHSLLNNHD
ncbi:ubiquitin receptor RAD23d-like isoform X3 [Dioscorea cayenensis subsp. rotundata]|uniref:Ubiquitin receptor RAD23d-like isoform X3 n=1 Tax=Dioscorea cayennensis subsp. rotundata TaxID=55577 RepID=A0AB40BJU1_DIOCR|nr:ubiquitin receptor RAD23d-like isoform X3 [Dioscorea cayenensis subsp. rotundata]